MYESDPEPDTTPSAEPLHGHYELPRYEEVLNAITHGLGLLLSCVGTISILSSIGSMDRGLAIGCLTYSLTLVAVYAVSTLSHAVHQPKQKYLLRAWDQGVIYLLIAGTYTPFACLQASAPMRWMILGGLWGLALAGFFSKVVLHHRIMAFKAHSYILLGWLPALAMLHLVSLACLMWMALGGLLYTVGTLFLVFDRHVRFFHATWHVFVVAGSACHFYTIMTFVVVPSIN